VKKLVKEIRNLIDSRWVIRSSKLFTKDEGIARIASWAIYVESTLWKNCFEFIVISAFRSLPFRDETRIVKILRISTRKRRE
jgi:hypothetical protein